jgi:hypothetical protein
LESIVSNSDQIKALFDDLDATTPLSFTALRRHRQPTNGEEPLGCEIQLELAELDKATDSNDSRQRFNPATRDLLRLLGSLQTAVKQLDEPDAASLIADAENLLKRAEGLIGRFRQTTKAANANATKKLSRKNGIDRVHKPLYEHRSNRQVNRQIHYAGTGLQEALNLSSDDEDESEESEEHGGGVEDSDAVDVTPAANFKVQQSGGRPRTRTRGADNYNRGPGKGGLRRSRRGVKKK